MFGNPQPILILANALGNYCSAHNLSGPCGGGGALLNFPTWYKYLCSKQVAGKCVPSIGSINDTWLIVAAVIEILLYVAGLIAVGFVIYGGITYMTSEGEPENTTRARDTIIHALVGLALAIVSASLVTFIAGNVL